MPYVQKTLTLKIKDGTLKTHVCKADQYMTVLEMAVFVNQSSFVWLKKINVNMCKSRQY